MDSLSPSDVVALQKGDGNSWGENSMFFWIFALMMLQGWGGYGNRNNDTVVAPPQNFVTQSELTSQLNSQTTQAQLQNLALSSANNNYETAQLINSQTNAMLQQNNTNLVNAIQGFNAVNQNATQGFNSVNQNIASQGNQISQAINGLAAQMDSCCCSIKTQMLQDRLSDAQTLIASQNAQISNNIQSQYLLGQMGRFVAWQPQGSSATTTTSVS